MSVAVRAATGIGVLASRRTHARSVRCPTPQVLARCASCSYCPFAAGASESIEKRRISGAFLRTTHNWRSLTGGTPTVLDILGAIGGVVGSVLAPIGL